MKTLSKEDMEVIVILMCPSRALVMSSSQSGNFGYFGLPTSTSASFAFQFGEINYK
jgi:hypothetical protein